MSNAIDDLPRFAGGAAPIHHLHPTLQLVLVGCVVAAFALAARWVIDPWVGDRHEDLPLYLSIAVATWFAGWRAGALASVLFLLAQEAWFGVPRSAADASQLHTELATWTYWAICALVIGAVHLARGELARSQSRARQLGESDHRKSDFMALLAHELRNPLSVLCNGTELIKAGKLDDHALDGAWNSVERQTEQMKRLVADLLDTARVEQGKLTLEPQATDIAALVTQAVGDAEAMAAAKRQRIRLSIPAPAGHITVDPQRIRQVLDNLLHNASKFSPDGSCIQVALDASAAAVTLTVRDNGIGIAPANLEPIFGSFVQLGGPESEVPSRGLGLGLALCRKLVQMHGGSIVAHSEGFGRGAEFIVRLPRMSAVATSGTSPDDPVAAAVEEMPRVLDDVEAAEPPQRAKVLVVDDNVDGAETLSMLLQMEGQDAVVAYDGGSALRLAREHGPQLAFIDMLLPDMNGRELAQRLRAQMGAATPRLVAMSGLDPDADGLPAGFDAWLVKPFELGDLRDVLAMRQREAGPVT